MIQKNIYFYLLFHTICHETYMVNTNHMYKLRFSAHERNFSIHNRIFSLVSPIKKEKSFVCAKQ